jgi:hypothetical protein
VSHAAANEAELSNPETLIAFFIFLQDLKKNRQNVEKVNLCVTRQG